MTPELTKKIEQEAEQYAAVQYGDPAKMEGLREVRHFDNGKEDYTAGATAWAEKVEVLEAWKAEATILLDPLLKYGQAHPDIKLGTSCTEFILNRAKAYDALLMRTGEMLAEKDAEIARLKSLIPIARTIGYNEGALGDNAKPSTDWARFIKENNL